MVNTRRSEQRWTEVVDGPYRYHLTRDFGEGEAGSMAFVMLNPSTADHLLNDDTVQRCSELAVARGCRTLEVGNLYALRATNPRDLNNEEDPKGPHNDEYLRCIATRCDTVVAAWGAGTGLHTSLNLDCRANHVLRLLWCAMENAGRTPSILRLGTTLTEGGHPRHPLPHDQRFGPEDLVPWVNGSPPQIE